VIREPLPGKKGDTGELLLDLRWHQRLEVDDQRTLVASEGIILEGSSRRPVGGRRRQDAFWKAITRLEVGVPQGRGLISCRSRWKESQEKPMLDKNRARTKTDTGRRDEYSQALERTRVKELCKLNP